MKPHERVFELQKHEEGVVTAYPYVMSSDTLQRMLFYHAAMTSNKNAILIFEEPEAHAFPCYTKHLGEAIALGDTNQYFIATHNPYLLSAVVEKAPKADVAAFATYYRDFATQVRLLSDDEVIRLLDADPFLGLELLLGNEGAG
jgi:AAA15 family ATPase/GTPase